MSDLVETPSCRFSHAKSHQENMSVQYIPPFLFLLQNIDCGYSLEPPRRGGSNVYTQSMF